MQTSWPMTYQTGGMPNNPVTLETLFWAMCRYYHNLKSPSIEWILSPSPGSLKLEPKGLCKSIRFRYQSARFFLCLDTSGSCLSRIIQRSQKYFHKTPIMLQAISLMIIGTGQNSLILQLSSEVHMRPCATVAKCPPPCAFCGILKCLNFLPLNSEPRSCADEDENAISFYSDKRCGPKCT